MAERTPSRSSIFREIAAAIGHAAARRLIEKMGGMRIYVPKRIGPDHEIAKSIGEEAARGLSSYFHGTWLQLPTMSAAARRQRVRQLARETSLTRAAIAREVGMSERQIYRIVDKERSRAADQADLFGSAAE